MTRHKSRGFGYSIEGGANRAFTYQPRPISDADLKLMHRIDKLHMEAPFAGSRMLQGLLVQEGFKVGRLHVVTMMKRMGIRALYRKPNTSKPAPGHKI
jgi:putative transposase